MTDPTSPFKGNFVSMSKRCVWDFLKFQDWKNGSSVVETEKAGTIISFLQNKPAELHDACKTIEYRVQSQKPVSPPVHIFVIDTSMPEDELSACKTAIQKALTTLPDYVQVGLITFGTHVHVHELGFQEISKSYVFQVFSRLLLCLLIPSPFYYQNVSCSNKYSL